MDNAAHVSVLGVGSYVPTKRLTNAELERLVDTSDAWITTRTGISERRVAESGQATSDLAHAAAAAALEDAGTLPESIDLIVVGTSTPDHAFPSVACKVQARLGCTRATAFDVNAACAGFLSALQVAEQFLRAGGATRALVIGADTMSRIVDYSDRTTCILFGDGAGAVVLAKGERPGLHATVTHADGTHYEQLYVHGGGSRLDTEGERPRIKMNGRAIFPLAVRAMISVTEEVLAKAGKTLDDVTWLVPHQANQRILKAVAEGLNVPETRVVSTIRDYGNNSAASVPLALDLAIRDGRIRRGDTVLLTAFGGGLAWGGALLTL
ncbi:3-oxoacyl-(acyl-carrier-protein) synthase III [Truepera radiovictrix DSM 17093]|uniref:Beta-ketoacyl-[acyl-carrier-protein] synthase III n=1 Tax=Truepera radiovictrix (strain DSM 17093 / CIP 108686 / LMG 22925 / RQ-24) TaxID=649638 RepID=D7CUE3_TRURR|nr:beta-ketoacyl-ACP synthase III [Truepera radiovictrix]ADI15728.1 3-oxoacyl-(acyl-carrier-protein) synthase III [Truepera radiovictrix DSM 17093]WMT58646.1 beta-ketoacyl-ACP synthase III [Truepera radiovictrix]